MSVAKKKVRTKLPKKVSRKRSVKSENRRGMRGGSLPGSKRKCGECGKLGHNARSHEKGGKFAS